jgi:hypothetical protein
MDVFRQRLLFYGCVFFVEAVAFVSSILLAKPQPSSKVSLAMSFREHETSVFNRLPRI